MTKAGRPYLSKVSFSAHHHGAFRLVCCVWLTSHHRRLRISHCPCLPDVSVGDRMNGRDTSPENPPALSVNGRLPPESVTADAVEWPSQGDISVSSSCFLKFYYTSKSPKFAVKQCNVPL